MPTKSKISSSTTYSEYKPNNTKYTKPAASQSSKMPWMASTAPSSHMDRQVQEKPSQWWATTKIQSGRASSPEHLTTSSLPSRRQKQENILFRLASSKYTTKIFLISSMARATTRKISRKALKLGCLSKDSKAYPSNQSTNCSDCLTMAIKTGLQPKPK